MLSPGEAPDIREDWPPSQLGTDFQFDVGRHDAATTTKPSDWPKIEKHAALPLILEVLAWFRALRIKTAVFLAAAGVAPV